MILVTGSRGPLGFGFKEMHPYEEFVFIDSNDCDLRNEKETTKFFKNLSVSQPIEAIINLAAKSGGVLLSKEAPANLINDNLLITLNVLKAAKENNIDRVILILSTACYSPDLIDPTEDKILEGVLTGNDYAYAYAKRMQIPIMNAFNAQFKMKISSAVVNGVIGPNMNFKDNESTLVAALIKRMYQNRDNSQLIEVWGDGSPIREFTYSGDLAKALLWCVQNQEVDSVLNIGTTEKTSVRQVTEIVADFFGISNSRIKFNTDKPNGRPTQSTNNEKFVAASRFKYLPSKKAIQSACQWYQNSTGARELLD